MTYGVDDERRKEVLETYLPLVAAAITLARGNVQHTDEFVLETDSTNPRVRMIIPSDLLAILCDLGQSELHRIVRQRGDEL